MAEEDSEALCVMLALVYNLTAERGSMAVGTKKPKEELDACAARICMLEMASATGDGELGVSMEAVRSLRSCVAVCEDRRNSGEARDFQTLDDMLEVRVLVERLDRTIGFQPVRVVGLVNAELVRIQLFITVALLENEGRGSEAICDGREGFRVEASSHGHGLSTRVSLIKP